MVEAQEKRAVRDLRDGDIVDLEGDLYAGQGDLVRSIGEFEYAVIEDDPEVETPTCTLIHTSQGSFGMPPDHELPYHGRFRR